MSAKKWTIEEALGVLAQGGIIIVADDEDRENEGDFILAAELATPEAVTFLAREGRGLLCAAMDFQRAKGLGLNPSPTHALHGTAFTESVDFRHGTSTGISSVDRSLTFQALSNKRSKPEDFARPGHVFPLVARQGGVLERRGHTEATVDLCRLAGLEPVGVLCEIIKDDGTMARYPDLEKISIEKNLPLITVEELVRWRKIHDSGLGPRETVNLPTHWGDFSLTLYDSPEGDHPLALHRGTDIQSKELLPPLVRIHSECLTGDLFASARCDCGPQLDRALELTAKEVRGAVVYLRQEGRGIGLAEKLKAYKLQESGLDTWQANEALGHQPDSRDYWEAAQILRSWGWTEVRLLTNNPEKVSGLEAYGIRVAERIPLEIPANSHNQGYLKTKKNKFGHYLSLSKK